VPQPGGGLRRMAPPPACGQHAIWPAVVSSESGLSWAAHSPF
jgi:hypothetical protein